MKGFIAVLPYSSDKYLPFTSIIDMWYVSKYLAGNGLDSLYHVLVID